MNLTPEHGPWVTPPIHAGLPWANPTPLDPLMALPTRVGPWIAEYIRLVFIYAIYIIYIFVSLILTPPPPPPTAILLM